MPRGKSLKSPVTTPGSGVILIALGAYSTQLIPGNHIRPQDPFSPYVQGVLPVVLIQSPNIPPKWPLLAAPGFAAQALAKTSRSSALSYPTAITPLGYPHQSQDGSDDNSDDDPDVTWGRRPHSPNPSISHFASSFPNAVGSTVSSGLPTDEELEREAERDRERPWREAERILTQEAEERRLMEEKVLAMLNISASPPKHVSPARSQSMPPMENPSPTPSQRDSAVSSWWNAAKNRLTLTKEPLTAAQQVIQETKEKEKRERKEAKKVEKERKCSADWPAVPENKFNNPTLLSLITPPKPPRQRARLCSAISDAWGSRPSFTNQDSLDVPGTLLVIARRFEKLEKWTVGHVRTLGERTSDVERWLVEKENEKGDDGGEDELVEMQGRIGELGREMAKFATSPGMLSTMPQTVSTAPQNKSSFAIHAQMSSSITVHFHSLPPNNSGSSLPAGAGALAARSRPVSVAGLPAPSPPPPASAPAYLPPERTGGTLAAAPQQPTPQQPTRASSSSISPTPRTRYTVALGEPIMKPRVSGSPPPISGRCRR
ncbi:hypothetical protein F5888DRAFT_1890539 [Russula emetica]|nr:hypothetical protein F5888DRAFT_1890539 [Russula emetica]